MNKTLPVFLITALGLLIPACVEQAPELTAAEREQLREHILTEAPTPQHELDVSFENRVRLLGYDIDVETATPGQPFTITWYWQAQRRLDAGWQIFTHLADSRGENRLNQDTEGVVRQIYQPGRWQEGEYIRDVQRVTLPADWGSDRVVFYMGLWNGPHRLAVSRGPNDGENRARAATITVSGGPSAAASPTAPLDPPARPQTPPPGTQAAHADAITIDGRLDEPSWQGASATSAFVSTVDGSPAELRASAKVLWNDQDLFVAFDVADTFLRNSLTGRDAHLWEQDAVEIMIDPDGDGQNYYEIQVSPTGEIFDTRYDSRRVPGPVGHADWNAPMSARVATRGTVNDDTDDQGYVVELALPWSAFSDAEGQALSAPPAGSSWRMNLYVMDTTRAGARSAGWSPTFERDFHVPARFGRVTFAAPPPPPVAAVAPAEESAAPRGGIIAPRVQLPPAQARAIERSLAGTVTRTEVLQRSRPPAE